MRTCRQFQAMPKRQRRDEGNILRFITCRCMLCSESEEASIALAERLHAEEEEGSLKRQKQEEDDAKFALGMYNCECVCSQFTLTLILTLTFTLQKSWICERRNSHQAHSGRQPRKDQAAHSGSGSRGGGDAGSLARDTATP